MSSLDPRILVEERSKPFVDSYSTMTGELSAVAQGQKALSMHDWPQSDVDNDEEHYEDFLRTALELGLVMTYSPYAVSIEGRQSKRVRTFAHRTGEAWRVPAFMVLMRALRDFDWSDGLEFLSSYLLGYSEEEIANWLTFIRHRQLGWKGNTVCLLVTDDQKSHLDIVGNRCIHPGALATDMTLFVPQAFFVLRMDAADIAATHGYRIARAAVSSTVLTNILGDRDASAAVAVAPLTHKHCQIFNSGLHSGLQFYKNGIWK